MLGSLNGLWPADSWGFREELHSVPATLRQGSVGQRPFSFGSTQMKCDLCGWEIETKPSGWDKGNNPAPLGEKGHRCCDWCNRNLVLPLRFRIVQRPENGDHQG